MDSGQHNPLAACIGSNCALMELKAKILILKAYLSPRYPHHDDCRTDQAGTGGARIGHRMSGYGGKLPVAQNTSEQPVLAKPRHSGFIHIGRLAPAWMGIDRWAWDQALLVSPLSVSGRSHPA